LGVFAVQKVSVVRPPRAFRLAVLFFLLTVFWGCHYRENLSVSLLPGGEVPLKRLVILPFEEKIPLDEAEKSAACPLCGDVFHTDKHTKAEGISLEDIFVARLSEYKQYTIVDPERSAVVYRRLSKSVQAPPAEILKLVGKELGADGVLAGYLFRYRERVGYWYSVEKPASVAFDVHLVRVDDGRVVWRAAFDKTQSSLMENVFQFSSFFTRGVKWLTARELAEEGIGEMVKIFPGIK